MTDQERQQQQVAGFNADLQVVMKRWGIIRFDLTWRYKYLDSENKPITASGEAGLGLVADENWEPPQIDSPSIPPEPTE